MPPQLITDKVEIETKVREIAGTAGIDLLKANRGVLMKSVSIELKGKADMKIVSPRSWETIKAVASDPRFIYIKGNHEDMLVKAMKDYIKYETYGGGHFDLLCWNGGASTFNGWINDGAKSGWYHYLRKLPLYLEYKNKNGITIMLCHAGFTPAKEPFPANEDLLWDREHIYDTTEGEGICVHGHTPISEYLILRLDNANNFLPPDRQFSYSYNGGALWYCDNHKVDIDCCSYMSGKTVLLNLDTFDEHIFTVDKEDE